jgi:hypothetical protein
MDSGTLSTQQADAASVTPVAVPPEAETAKERLRAALQGVGFEVERDFEHCRADVTTSGMGNVTIGRLSLTTANRLSAVLEALALAARPGQPSDRADRGLPEEEEVEPIHLPYNPADAEHELAGRQPGEGEGACGA